MKRVIAFLIFLPYFTVAQKEANNWCFGSSLRIDFNYNSPIVSKNISMWASEGCSSISDSNGNLLLYSNGEAVWDRNYNILPNGTGLLGGPSSTQAALLIQKPQSLNKYYLLTTDEQGGPNGLRYSEIDITLNGGNGDIIAGRKNILLQSQCGEKISVAKHSNGIDLWILTHDLNTNVFCSYLITSTGVNNIPILSTAGSSLMCGGNCDGATGQLKFSPTGEKLAVSGGATQLGLSFWGPEMLFEIYKFDKSTGKVFAPITLKKGFFPYSFEFSPDGSKLYFTDINFDLIQLDISNFDSLSIMQSKVIINSSQYGHPNYGTYQLAPNGKIYIIDYNDYTFSKYLAAISCPNNKGLSCGFNNQELLIPPSSPFSFPNIPPYYLYFTLKADAGNDTSICYASTINIGNLSPEKNITYQWQPIQGLNNSNIAKPVLRANSNTTYTLTATDINGCNVKDSITINVMPLSFGIARAGENKIICKGDTVKIGELPKTGYSYLWQPNIGLNDLTMAEPFSFPNYTTTYYLTVTDSISNYICKRSGIDSVTITVVDCPIAALEIPNVFTPNDDEINDVFIITDLPEASAVTIYNRYGTKMNDFTGVKDGWDGRSSSGQACPEGVYYYLVTLPDGSNKKGFVHLLR